MRTGMKQTTETGRTDTKDAQADKAHADDTKPPPHSGGWPKGWFTKPMPPVPWPNAGLAGSLDGNGAADHDQPYRFGFRPRASAPYPFNTRQYARLLVLRSRVRDHVETSVEVVPAAVRSSGLRPAA